MQNSKSVSWLLLLSNICASANSFRGIHETCEPLPIPYSRSIWISKFNMGTISDAFLGSVEHENNYESTEVHNHSIKATIKLILLNTGYIHPFRRWRIEKMYHFIHGDAAIFHTIDSRTGEYRRIELGFHTKNLFISIARDHWVAIDIQAHCHQDFVVLGVDLFYERNNKEELVWGVQSDLIGQYPLHEKIIRRFT